MKKISYRQALKSDCAEIVSLYSIASDGVADYVWTMLAGPNESIHDVGLKRYEQEDAVYSYRNCKVASVDGQIAGMMVAYPMHSKAETDYSPADPVLAPYARLEEHNSYYISGMAVFPKYRGMGIGTCFLKTAESQAIGLGLNRLSLIVFEQNLGARTLYERTGYTEDMRETIVPHPLIRYTGDALLMVKSLA